MVFIKSPKGYVFAYGGNAKLNVKVGDSVTKGQSLGNLGLNPNEGEAKVFFCVSLDGKPVNPYAAPR
jgi:septal ring factor EnvC (AmiA/AmiB activator)